MQPLRGIALKICAVIVFMAMASLVKLVSVEIPPGETVFFRSAFALPVILVWLAVSGELRAGAEVVASLFPRGAGTDWVAAGPNLAWTHGRFWLAASLPIGLSNIDAAARVRWGIAF